MAKPLLPSLFDMLGLSLPIRVVDIGANPLVGGPAPYLPLLEAGRARIIGFEPNPLAMEKLTAQKGPHETYLPWAVADGKTHTLRLCRNSGMSSLLEPNPEWNRLFHFFEEWSIVVQREEIPTVRLDDVPQTEGADFIKIDVQGSELMVFENAPQRLAGAVLVHAETLFVPMYQDQPLFSEIEQCLRKNGFMLHRFESLVSRTVKPTNPYAGLNQVMWGDAVFVRDFTKPDLFTDEQLLRLALILHDCYRAFDIVLHLLGLYDARRQAGYAAYYEGILKGIEARLAYDQRLKQVVV